MKVSRHTALPVLAVVAVLALSACEGTESAAPAETVTVTPSASQTQSEADKAMKEAQEEGKKNREELKKSIEAAAPEADKAKLPNLVGMDLQAAQDTAQAAGFYLLDDQDASGQGRLQVFDRNWTVCSQDPAPGTRPVAGLVTLFAVKDNESC
ncbi:PASTA domain-containing protein [Streptomyces sp. NPDC088727]|uniref:PASTA domain-containing protein n=1 Tax=Streptomyces sp. NPDC088727 TaxID=3365875 RepID=UPI003822A730